MKALVQILTLIQEFHVKWKQLLDFHEFAKKKKATTTTIDIKSI